MVIKYRPEIDGLRALAVIAVVLFHADLTLFSEELLKGGYVGVDVFFVISGYLITSILIREIESESFTFKGFYERRARRILPVLFVVMLMSIPFAWIYLLPKGMLEYAGAILSSVGFGSNIWFWIEDGYWAEHSSLKPFLHTWSLSVEEQFYLVFPVFLIVVNRYAQKYIPIILLVLLFLSLAYANYMSEVDAKSSFYLLQYRGWELLAGCLLAHRESQFGRSSHSLLTRFMPKVGIVLILFALVFFDEQTKHPSYFTAIPIVGTMILIWYCQKGELVSVVLSSRVSVRIGLLSYGIYLWHFPIFAFARLRFPNIMLLEWCGLIIFSVFFAWLTYVVVEKPARDRKRLKSKYFVYLMTGAVLVIVVFMSSIYKFDGYPNRLPFNEDFFSTFERSDRTVICWDAKVRAGCSIGKKGSELDFVVIGDSHALSALALFDRLGSQYSKTGYFSFNSGCVPLLGIVVDRIDSDVKACIEANQNAINLAASKKEVTVFLIARWDYYVDGSNSGDHQPISLPGQKFSLENSRQVFLGEMRRTLLEFSVVAENVVILLQPPHQRGMPLSIFTAALNKKGNQSLKAFGSGVKKYISAESVSRSSHISRQLLATTSILTAAEGLNNVYVLDPTDLLCDEVCLIGDAEGSFYYDDDHLSVYGYKKLRNIFSQFFK